MRSTIDFWLNGERISVPAREAARPVLAWLREARGLAGTKEGCAEGDCGACTIAVSRQGAAGRIECRPLASCILFLGALDGTDVLTVEGLGTSRSPHPVQQAMAECHGSQCGFCTPGFVIALYALYRQGAPAGRGAACDALAGNLCRCTGYAPILAAAERMQALRPPGELAQVTAACAARLASLPAEPLEDPAFSAPTGEDALAARLLREPGAVLLGGGTDLGLRVTKQLEDLPPLVATARVAELQRMDEGDHALEIGAAVTYADALAALGRLHPDLAELVRRIGGAQVRAGGTLAGNIANGSPIGDTMPALLALGATLDLRRGDARRDVPLDAFYTGYRRSVLAPGEFIRAVRVPRLAPGARFAAYKLSKRFDQDISTVCAAFLVDGKGRARFGFGGMAATPARAPRAEAAYARGLDAACAALAEDFAPLSDHRGSAEYRLAAARALLGRFHRGASSRELLELAP